MSVGMPVKLLHEAVEHVVTVELNSGELYKGTLTDSEHYWNCVLENVTFTAMVLAFLNPSHNIHVQNSCCDGIHRR